MLGRIIIVASVALSVLAVPLPAVKEANTVAIQARQAFVEPAFVSNGRREPENWQKRQNGQGYHTDIIDHGSAKRQDGTGYREQTDGYGSSKRQDGTGYREETDGYGSSKRQDGTGYREETDGYGSSK